MDTDTIAIVVAIVGVGVALSGIGITVLIVLLRGFFRLGQLFQRLDAQDENISQVRDAVQQLRTETRDEFRQVRDETQQLRTEMRDDIQQLTAVIRQTNEMVIALANHRHDQDGNIIFILPVQPGG